MTRTGGCLCGAVRYEVEGEPREAAHCHCRMCQMASGAACITWATFLAGALRYTTGAPARYRSSERVQREFCGRCGSPLAFRAARLGTVDVSVTTLDKPDTIVPVANIWTSSRRAWAHGFDERLEDYPGHWPGDET